VREVLLRVSHRIAARVVYTTLDKSQARVVGATGLVT
jgi:hypothetical protein